MDIVTYALAKAYADKQIGTTAVLDESGKVPSTMLPSYVDDIVEYDDILYFPAIGEKGKIYVDLATNKTYRWSGSTYIEISSPEVIQATSLTIQPEDWQKKKITKQNIASVQVQKTAWGTTTVIQDANTSVLNDDIVSSDTIPGSLPAEHNGSTVTQNGWLITIGGTSDYDFVYELKEPEAIAQVVLKTIKNETSLGTADMINIALSEDGNNWMTYASRYYTQENYRAGTAYTDVDYVISINNNIPKKYIKIGYSHTQYLFATTEVEIYSIAAEVSCPELTTYNRNEKILLCQDSQGVANCVAQDNIASILTFTAEELPNNTIKVEVIII